MVCPITLQQNLNHIMIYTVKINEEIRHIKESKLD